MAKLPSGFGDVDKIIFIGDSHNAPLKEGLGKPDRNVVSVRLVIRDPGDQVKTFFLQALVQAGTGRQQL